MASLPSCAASPSGPVAVQVNIAPERPIFAKPRPSRSRQAEITSSFHLFDLLRAIYYINISGAIMPASVLVVEDNLTQREICTTALKELGLEPICTDSGTDAL